MSVDLESMFKKALIDESKVLRPFPFQKRSKSKKCYEWKISFSNNC